VGKASLEAARRASSAFQQTRTSCLSIGFLQIAPVAAWFCETVASLENSA
jgi:hypothetical protein